MTLRAIIADDERLMRDQLRSRLAEAWPGLEVVAEAKNGIEAVELTRRHRPDIVFLDIRMPGLTGVEAARQIAQLSSGDDDADADAGSSADAADAAAANPADPAAAADAVAEAPAGWPGCEIVFITAYDQYAVEAFEQGVVDYVLKPAERERLALTAQRITKRIADRMVAPPPPLPPLPPPPPPPAGVAAPPMLPLHTPDMQHLLQKLARRLDPAAPPRLKWIQASVGQSIQMIPVDEVLFFISDEKYTRVQTANVEALIRKPIKELLDELDPDTFWQIHRSTLVNTRAIAGVSRDLRGRQLVSVKGRGEKLEVSRSFAGLFKGM